jgi:hypothetical protein
MRIQKPVKLKEYPPRPPEQLVSEIEPFEVVVVVVVQSPGLGRICARVFSEVVVLTLVRKIAAGPIWTHGAKGAVGKGFLTTARRIMSKIRKAK